MFLIKFKNGIEWNSLDGKDIKTAFALTIPEDGAENHLKILSAIATELIIIFYQNIYFKISLVIQKVIFGLCMMKVRAYMNT